MTPTTTRRVDYVILALTVLAAADTFPVPPQAKPWVILAGVVAKLILSEMKNRQTANKEEL